MSLTVEFVKIMFGFELALSILFVYNCSDFVWQISDKG